MKQDPEIKMNTTFTGYVTRGLWPPRILTQMALD